MTPRHWLIKFAPHCSFFASPLIRQPRLAVMPINSEEAEWIIGQIELDQTTTAKITP